MRCSKCSEEVKPVVALDIDGTIGDYHRHFIGFAEHYVGRQLGRAWDYDGRMSFRGWFNDTCGIGTEEYRAIKLAYRQGGMKRSMPVIPFGPLIAKLVRSCGAELWMTTTRPYLSLDNIVPDTVEWLRRHEIAYDGMLFDELKFEQFAHRVDPERVILILDDLREMCEAAEALFPGRAVQVATRFNLADRFTVSSTLDACAEIIFGRIEEWREQNGN